MHVDDIMVLFRGTKNNQTCLMIFFLLYGTASGQILNLEKCKFYLFRLLGISSTKIQMVQVLRPEFWLNQKSI